MKNAPTIRVLSQFGLVVGFVAVVGGLLQECRTSCPAQVVGQTPIQCSCVPPLAYPLVIVGASITTVSALVLAFTVIHCNFVKPHSALEGQTPAERAGVGVQGQNKWLELLRNSAKSGASAN